MFVDLTLTDEQEAAVAHDGGHLLVVAGAGTGKTTTLTARLAHLVERGVAPERIVALTFTRRAAAELTHRAEARTGHQVAGRCWSGTFHSVAARHLRRWGRAVGVDPGFGVLDAADSADLLALLRDELVGPGDGARRGASKSALAAIWSRCVNAHRPLPEVVRERFAWCEADLDLLGATFRAYTERKRAMGMLDYDDLLVAWWALLRHPELSPRLAASVEHVLVDELQDTNPLQIEVLEAFAGVGATLSAVGDDAQAIYSFRGADVSGILDFPARFGARVVTLTRNHRSTPEVLATANAVMEGAARRHPKALRAQRPSGPRPRLVDAHDEHAQAVAVTDAVIAAHGRGVALRRQAVLYRTGHHADALQLELTVRNVPFVAYGGLRFLEAAHVKDLICLCRLVTNPADDLAWFRVLQLLDGVGPGGARRIVAALGTAGPAGRVAAAAAVAGLPAEAAAGAGALDEALDAARDPALAEAPGAQIAAVRRWLDPRLARRHRDAAARVADLERLESAAGTSGDLAGFLTDLVLDPPASTGDLAGAPSLDEDVLTLSTIHSAKGGEWDVVHVLAVVDGCLPSDLATGDAEGIEEERRLLHVAATRARDELVLHAPLRWHHHRQSSRGRDRHGYALRSRFLTDDVVATLDVAVAADPTRHDGAEDVPAGARAAIDDYLGALLG